MSALAAQQAFLNTLTTAHDIRAYTLQIFIDVFFPLMTMLYFLYSTFLSILDDLPLQLTRKLCSCSPWDDVFYSFIFTIN